MAAGRKPLPRWRVSFVVAYDFGAPDYGEAQQRAELIRREVAHRLEPAGAIGRIAGSPKVTEWPRISSRGVTSA